MNEQPDDTEEAAGPRRGALIALVVIAALVAGGLWLSHTLRGVGQVQDCVMAGRSNCAPVQAQ
ncbi:MAG: hypothetical protein J0I21_04015 [Alphaproteobacteria bacterium]|nr:hypothetical protein [Alphaproteobacteria bacterium]